VEYGKRIYRNLASPVKEWYQLDQGDHYNLARVGGEDYHNRIREFLRNYLKK